MKLFSSLALAWQGLRARHGYCWEFGTRRQWRGVSYERSQ